MGGKQRILSQKNRYVYKRYMDVYGIWRTKSTFSHSFSFLNHLNHPQRHRPQHDSDTALQSLGHGEDEFYVDIQLGDRILNFLTSYTTENIHTIL